MKNNLFIFLASALLAVSAEAKKPNVFACTPEWASLTLEIAGDKVNIFTATTAQQDPHLATARPSLIAQMRKADLLVCSGGGLEEGWLPTLQKNAGGPSVQEHGEHAIMATKYVKMIEIPKKIDRSLGDLHPEGNPHVHLNPHNLLPVADVILKRLSALAPEHKTFFEERHQKFSSKLKSQIKIWAKQAEPLKGMRVISNEMNMSYMYEWLGIVYAGTLQPLPGLPPTLQRLSQLVEVAKAQRVALIEYAPFESPKSAQWLSSKTGIPHVELPFTVGGGGTEDLWQLFEKTIQILLSKGEGGGK